MWHNSLSQWSSHHCTRCTLSHEWAHACPNKQAHMPTYPKHSRFKLWRPTPSPLIYYSCVLLSIPLLSVSLCLTLSHTRTLVWLRVGECYDAMACLSSFPSCVLQGKDEERREEERGRRLHQHRSTAFIDTQLFWMRERKCDREEGSDGRKRKMEGMRYFTLHGTTGV